MSRKVHLNPNLENDPDLLHVCWSRASYIWWREGGGFVTHIVDANGRKTLCGKRLVSWDGNAKPYWDFEIWSFKEDGWGADTIGCLNCRRSRKLTLHDNEEINEQAS